MTTFLLPWWYSRTNIDMRGTHFEVHSTTSIVGAMCASIDSFSILDLESSYGILVDVSVACNCRPALRSVPSRTDRTSQRGPAFGRRVLHIEHIVYFYEQSTLYFSKKEIMQGLLWGYSSPGT